MRPGGTLLERLAAGETRPARLTTEEDWDGVAESVRSNLTRLFAARQGMSEAVLDYGLPEATYPSAETARKLQEAIRSLVEKYEPRLKNPRVSLVADTADDRRLVFHLEGTLTRDGRRMGLSYKARIGPSGKVEVTD